MRKVALVTHRAGAISKVYARDGALSSRGNLWRRPLRRVGVSKAAVLIEAARAVPARDAIAVFALQRGSSVVTVSAGLLVCGVVSVGWFRV